MVCSGESAGTCQPDNCYRCQCKVSLDFIIQICITVEPALTVTSHTCVTTCTVVCMYMYMYKWFNHLSTVVNVTGNRTALDMLHCIF